MLDSRLRIRATNPFSPNISVSNIHAFYDSASPFRPRPTHRCQTTSTRQYCSRNSSETLGVVPSEMEWHYGIPPSTFATYSRTIVAGLSYPTVWLSGDVAITQSLFSVRIYYNVYALGAVIESPFFVYFDVI
ncbi:hypothetical protein V3C99_011501 [Haemonchus contortus]